MILDYPLITSILDSDWYKFTMQQLILRDFPDINVSYQFINRGKTIFPLGFDVELRRQIQFLSNLSLTNEEKIWLMKIPYIRPSYVDYLSKYKFDPDCITVNQIGGELSIDIKGKWEETILFEVPLMSIISELYFKMSDSKLNDNWETRLENKAKNLQDSECLWSEFGTRRRHSFLIQDYCVSMMKNYNGFIGTSNPHMAIKYAINQIGTSAHELIMGMAGLYGVLQSNKMYLQKWENFYGKDLSIALTDTYTTDIFLKNWDCPMALYWNGLRQDSGNCEEWATKIISHYNRLGVSLRDKILLFSDNLDDEKYKKLSLKYRKIARIVGGIGTDFSNYCSDRSPLNMVIKLVTVNGIDVVKLSDTHGKYTGNPLAITNAKEQLGIT